MKKRLIGVLAFALAVSAGAAFVLYQLIASKITVGASAKPTTSRVFVAARDLSMGALITERDIGTEEYLTPPSGALLKKEDILNRGVTAPIHRDAPFYDVALAPKGAGAGFAATIPAGMRAFAVHVNDVVGVAGFVVAGMHVDLLVSGTPPGGAGENVGNITRTLLQNVEVLSAGQNYQKDAEGKPVVVQVVNLLVTPEQAELLNLATQQTIQLVLRNPTDHELVKTEGASTQNLFSGTKIHAPRIEVEAQHAQRHDTPEVQASPGTQPVSRATPSAVASKTRTVTIEVYQGGRKVESTFQNPDAPPVWEAK